MYYKYLLFMQSCEKNPHACFLYAYYWQNIKVNKKYFPYQNYTFRLLYSYGNASKIQWQNLYVIHLKFVESFW